FATAPTAEEIAAFAADQTPGALDALAKRLDERPNTVEFAGKLPPAPVKFRVLAADPAADKTPRVVLGPGEYPLSEGTAEYGAVTLKIIGKPVGDRRTNDAQLIFEPTEFTGNLPPDPHKLELPDGWGTWAIACRPGEGFFYVLHKGGARKIDYTKPREVADTPATDLPAEFRDEVKRQLDLHEVSDESQAEVFERPAPPAATPAPKTAEAAPGPIPPPSDGTAVAAGQDRTAEPLDWWQTERDVTAALDTPGADIAALAEGARSAKPATGREAMFNLALLLRAGMNREAQAAIKQLKRTSPDLHGSQLRQIYHTVGDQMAAWDVARTLVEEFAETIHDIDLSNRLFEHMAKGRTKPEAFQEIDPWLARMPAGYDYFWIKERLKFHVEMGNGEALAQDLIDQVRAHPDDARRAIAMIDAFLYARPWRDGDPTPDFDWLSRTVHPKLATEAADLAERLANFEQPATALAFFGRALELRLADAEIQDLSRMSQAVVLPETMRVMFKARLLEGMAGCLSKLGQKDEAQRRMDEVAELRKKPSPRPGALPAGQVREAGGQKEIEDRIRPEEQPSVDDPAYWRQRADYFRGRNDAVQEEQALKKGLSLAKPLPAPDRKGKGWGDMRASLIGAYSNFLLRQKREDEAVALMRGELAQSPAASESSHAAARHLAFDFPQHARADDEILWKWLSGRPKWEHVEERVLWHMLENATADELDKHFSRAEQLADGSDATRAARLGWIMNRMRHTKRSIPLLEQAIRRANDDVRANATFTLLESCLDLGDWQRAEELFPEASKRLTAHEQPEWCSRIALIAANAGAKADALRIWKTGVAKNPVQMHGLKALAEAGLRDELTDFYRQMQERLPASEVPANALKTLAGTTAEPDDARAPGVTSPDPPSARPALPAAQPDPPTAPPASKAAEAAPGPARPPSDGTQDQSGQTQKDPLLRPVSLVVDNMPMRTALEALARAAGLKIEFDLEALQHVELDLQKPVTVRLENVPLQRALGHVINWENHPGVMREVRGGKLVLTTLEAWQQRIAERLPEWMKPFYNQGLLATLDDNDNVVSVTTSSIVTDELLAKFATLAQLKELQIEVTNGITIAGLAHLGKMAHLEKLSLYSVNSEGTALGDEAIRSVVGLASLRDLSVNECGVTDAGAKWLEQLPQLTSLDLQQEGRLTDKALSSIGTLSKLESLSLNSYVGNVRLGWMRFSAAGIRQLKELKGLKSLHLVGQEVTADILDFPKLTSLSLGHASVDDDVVARIGELRSLRYLELSYCGFGNNGLKTIASLPDLQRLTISGSTITDAGLEHLRSHKTLEHLTLRVSGLTDLSLEHVAHIKTLTRLDLYGSGEPGVAPGRNFGMAGLSHLKQLPSLETLWLTNFDLQGGYAGLKELRQLRELTMMMCNISHSELEALEEALPNTRISHATGGGDWTSKKLRQPVPATVMVTKDGSLLMNDKPVTLDELKAAAARKPGRQFIIRAEKDAPFAKVQEIVEALKSAGVKCQLETAGVSDAPPATSPAPKSAEASSRADGAQLRPKHETAQALFKNWKASARSDGKIPGGLVGQLAAQVDSFLKQHPKDGAAPKLAALRPKLDASRDWAQAEVVAALDEIAAVATAPLGWANIPMEFDAGRNIRRGAALPKELESAAWGTPAENGLRAAWLLEPRAEKYAAGTVLKARVLFHNAGKAPVVFQTETWHQDDKHTARDARGVEIPVKATWFTGITPMATCLLAPGEYCEVMGHGIAIGAGEYKDEHSTGSVGAIIEAKVGDSVTLTHIVDAAHGAWTRPGDLKVRGQLIDKYVHERIARLAPMPKEKSDREQIIRHTTPEILGVLPSADEIAAFVGDDSPDALEKLTARLVKQHAERPETAEPFIGKLPTGETKFRVIAADPNATKAPRTANGPGRYVLGDGMHLQVRQVTEGDMRTNSAEILFVSPDPKVASPHKPFAITLPGSLESFAFVWERGSGVLWLCEIKGMAGGGFVYPIVSVRRFDIGEPGSVRVSRPQTGDQKHWSRALPAHMHEPVMLALGSNGKMMERIRETQVPESAQKRTEGGSTLDAATEAQLDWGEVVNGLRGAVIIRGEPQGIYLAVQNVSPAPLRFTDTVKAKDLRQFYPSDAKGILFVFTSDEPTHTDVLLQPREVAYLRMMPPLKEGEHSPEAGLIEGIRKDALQTWAIVLHIATAPEGAWRGKLITADTRCALRDGGPQPKNERAQALFKHWQSSARLNGDIPGGLVRLLHEKVKDFIRANEPDTSGGPFAQKMKPLEPRFANPGDWKAADVVALLDDIAAVHTIPLDSALTHLTQRTLYPGTPLPASLEKADWGEPLPSGLRVAHLLEPRAGAYHLG
ncbi:MAG: biopolymer transporter ExbD, partial [Verrucomicrobiales bacterium]